ncbi:galactose oxidase [Rhizophagus irregularis]|uniref:Galactose oxidase n=1 Tax=Rhizophagus irregularis TaxID=588596 RepID=A0A2N1N2K4_9GLOM|nr:galactose oxidase [Rhizophagus irregularis]
MGYKILNHHLMLILLIQLSLWVTIINGRFIPGPRSGHTAILIGDKIYFIGGYNFSIISKESDIFYYNGIAWVDLNNQVSGQGADMPLKFGHTANVGGRKQDLIFFIGGDQLPLIYQLDTKTNKITSSVILGAFPNRDSLNFMSSVFYEGIIYLFGGGEMDIETDITTLYNNHYIFDTINLNWQEGGLINAPPPRYKHTATLANGIIYYIGGIQINNSYVSYTSMSDIYRYNTVSNKWSLEVATLAPGNTPGPRLGHSAALVENKICIFGGSYNNLSPIESIAMLNTSTLEWSIPHFNNPRRPNMPTLPNLVYHTATLVDKRMLPQGNLGQEDFILPIPSNGDRFSNRSSNYHPRSETNSHSQKKSEAQTLHVYTMLISLYAIVIYFIMDNYCFK